MITVHFPKYIQTLTDGVSKHNFDTQSISVVLDGIRLLFPKLSLYITQIVSQQVQSLVYFMDKDTKKIIQHTVTNTIKSSDLVFIITMYGQGEDVTTIAIGAALVAAAFIPGLQGLAIGTLTMSGFLLSTGISMVLSGVLNALGSRPTSNPQGAPDSPARVNNDSFEGLTNTTSTDTPIPLIYGHHRVGGQFVSGKIKTINHDRGTYISVANYI